MNPCEPLQRPRHTWAVVLAAGEGCRLRAMTTTAGAVSVPKQYCSVWGDHSLLQDALWRARAVVAEERVCVVVAEQHRRWWDCSLWPLCSSNTIVHPVNRGSGNSVLQALLRIAAWDPDAQVLLLPSDHHVLREAILEQAMRGADTYARAHPNAVVLLGLDADEANPELGYIVPGTDGDASTFDVTEFAEKPTPLRASTLTQRGALWNAFIVAASAHALLRLYESHHDRVVRAMRRYLDVVASGADRVALAEAFARLPTLDFSHDILHGHEDHLRVLRVPPCGWTDLGTPRALAKIVAQGRGEARPESVPWEQVTVNLSRQQQQPWQMCRAG